jgi:RNA polymerase sigma factor (TIGR02999 family)
MEGAQNVTELLAGWSDGGEAARSRVIEIVYRELHRVAERHMRRILVDHARARAAAKRGNGTTVALREVDVAVAPIDVDIVALDAALEKLTRVDPRQSQLVELRFFGGLTVEETAAFLDVAPITVKREWALARAWLFRELQRAAP